MFEIAKGPMDAIDAFNRGEKVVWLPEMSWLLCFVGDFNAQMGQYIAHWIPPGYFELLYMFSRNRIVGIKFAILPAQLMEDNWLLAQQCKEDGSLNARDILTSCENLAGRVPEAIEPSGLALAKHFLQEHNILISSKVWECALPRIRQ